MRAILVVVESKILTTPAKIEIVFSKSHPMGTRLSLASAMHTPDPMLST